MPKSVAARFTGLGESSPPRPRRLSTRVITNATSTPAATNARSGDTATSGVPRNTMRLAAPVGNAARVVTSCVSGLVQLQVERLGVLGLMLSGPIQGDGLLALIGGHAVEHEHAVEMIDFVLEQSRQ